MRIEATIPEAWEIGRALEIVPPFVRSLDGEGDEIRVAIDLREIPDAPSALRLAARLVPIVRATVRIISFSAGTAVIAMEANAGGLPAHKLLGFIEAPLAGILRAKNLPPDCVKILPDAHVAVDVQSVLAAKGPKRMGGMQVTDLGYNNSVLRAVAVL